MISIDAAVREFAQLLDRGWDLAASAAARAHDPDLVAAWTQANWEMLVEYQLERGARLAVYNGGADYHGASSRIAYPEALPTHIVVLVPRSPGSSPVDLLSGTPMVFPDGGLPLDALVSKPTGYYAFSPPFDHALVVHDTQLHQLFSLDDVVFFVRQLREEEI